ncbi:MAG: Ldh family oxidoreductase [Paenibacillaceae bacterium]|nr:Ldh family oxidoreductase [Paenibacillaceae bacterium]
MNRIKFEHLHAFMSDLLVGYGFPERQSSVIADVLVTADFRGVLSHGCSRMATYYVPLIKEGIINTTTEPILLQSSSFYDLYDANKGSGMYTSYVAIQKLMQKVRKSGFAIGSVTNSTHFGMAGYYSLMVAREGLIGITFTNGAPAVVAPGGDSPFLGTNAISIGIPKLDEQPVLIDVALSSSSLGELLHASEEGRQIPREWCSTALTNVLGLHSNQIDPDIPFKQRAINPLGAGSPSTERKGFLISLLFELSVSLIFGGDFSFSQRVGEASHFFIVINPFVLEKECVFHSKLETLIQRIKQYNVMEGYPDLRVPGENGHTRELMNRMEGIMLSVNTINALIEIAQQVNVRTPEEFQLTGNRSAPIPPDGLSTFVGADGTRVP